MSIGSMIIALALLVPFFGWGVYTLRARYQYHEELHRFAEWATVAGVLVIFSVEMSLLRGMSDPWLYAGSGLGLALAMVALYGHIMVSVLSSFFVDAMMPNMDTMADRPQYGPAEALERLGEYDSALQEYLVIARIFPKDPETSVRIAKLLLQVDRVDEAAKAYQRAFDIAEDEEQALGVANRLNELYRSKLDDPASGEAILKKFLERYPNSKRTDSVVRRMGRRDTASSIQRVREEIAEEKQSREVQIEVEPSEEVVAPAIAASRIPNSTWDAEPVAELELPISPEPEKIKAAKPKPAKSVSKPKPKPKVADQELSLDWSSVDEPEATIDPDSAPEAPSE